MKRLESKTGEYFSFPQLVFIEGASQDSWHESHAVIITAFVPPHCQAIRIGEYHLEYIGAIGEIVRIGQEKTDIIIEFLNVGEASHYEIDRPRYVIAADGRVFYDRELLNETTLSSRLNIYTRFLPLFLLSKKISEIKSNYCGFGIN